MTAQHDPEGRRWVVTRRRTGPDRCPHCDGIGWTYAKSDGRTRRGETVPVRFPEPRPDHAPLRASIPTGGMLHETFCSECMTTGDPANAPPPLAEAMAGRHA